MTKDQLDKALVVLAQALRTQPRPLDREAVILSALALGRDLGVAREHIDAVLDTPLWSLAVAADAVSPGA